MTTRIVCVGNELVSDDGLGIRVGRALQRLPLPAGVEVVFAADIGLDLIDTVMSAVRRVEKLRKADPQVNAHLEAIERRLASSES